MKVKFKNDPDIWIVLNISDAYIKVWNGKKGDSIIKTILFSQVEEFKEYDLNFDNFNEPYLTVL